MKIPVNATHASEAVGDMLEVAGWVQKQTGTPIAKIITEAVERAFEIAGFDNHTLSQFIDLIDEVQDELVFQHDELQNPVNRSERN